MSFQQNNNNREALEKQYTIRKEKFNIKDQILDLLKKIDKVTKSISANKHMKEFLESFKEDTGGDRKALSKFIERDKTILNSTNIVFDDIKKKFYKVSEAFKELNEINANIAATPGMREEIESLLDNFEAIYEKHSLDKDPEIQATLRKYKIITEKNTKNLADFLDDESLHFNDKVKEQFKQVSRALIEINAEINGIKSGYLANSNSSNSSNSSNNESNKNTGYSPNSEGVNDENRSNIRPRVHRVRHKRGSGSGSRRRSESGIGSGSERSRVYSSSGGSRKTKSRRSKRSSKRTKKHYSKRTKKH
jgi:hypothetical protein